MAHRHLWIQFRKKRRKSLSLFLLLVLFIVFLVQSWQAFSHISQEASQLNPVPTMTVVLDAGHGGEDGGAQAPDGRLEKTYNLEIAQILRRYLQNAGFSVIMTRETDDDLSDPSLPTIHTRKEDDLRKREQLVRDNSPCYFISIHQNKFSDSQYEGAQVLYSPNHEESQKLAQSIQESFASFLQPNNTRTPKAATDSIYLLWHIQQPAVLVECGFLSNEEEAVLLQNPVYQRKVASCILLGLAAYLETEKGVVISSASWYDDTITSLGAETTLWLEKTKYPMFVRSVAFLLPNGTGNAQAAASGIPWKKNWRPPCAQWQPGIRLAGG